MIPKPFETELLLAMEGLAQAGCCMAKNSRLCLRGTALACL